MESDGDALARAVLAAPADDAPRLVYADWIDEHSDHEYARALRAAAARVRVRQLLLLIAEGVNATLRELVVYGTWSTHVTRTPLPLPECHSGFEFDATIYKRALDATLKRVKKRIEKPTGALRRSPRPWPDPPRTRR